MVNKKVVVLLSVCCLCLGCLTGCGDPPDYVFTKAYSLEPEDLDDSVVPDVLVGYWKLKDVPEDEAMSKALSEGLTMYLAAYENGVAGEDMFHSVYPKGSWDEDSFSFSDTKSADGSVLAAHEIEYELSGTELSCTVIDGDGKETPMIFEKISERQYAEEYNADMSVSEGGDES